MMNTKHKGFARALSLLLVVAMFAGLLAISANAANATNVKHYDNYVCIGDSIAAGYGPYAEWVRGFVTVPEAYHSLVANATGANLQSLSHVGMRTEEIRYLLEDNYAGDDVCMYFNGMIDYAEWMESREGPNDPAPEWMNEYVYEELKDYYGPGALERFYRDNVSNADLITLGLGLNDVFLYAMKKTAVTLDMLRNDAQIVAVFLYYMQQGYQRYLSNWAPLIRDIKALNPDVTLVVVGLYNPFAKVKLTEDSLIQIGEAADVIVAGLNAYLKSQANSLGYLYADVSNTELCDTVPFTDEGFFDAIVCDCHPTEAGHQYMANQILSVLPEAGQEQPLPTELFPFTDVQRGDWFYNDVYYAWENGIMNGVSEQIFQPNGYTTRAQFATVLYRMAGSPSTYKLTNPFTDLTADWYRDAVTWCYFKGIVNGTSATTFDPDARITREQMVAMLWRYAGSPVVSGWYDGFTDGDLVSEYAVIPVLWAVFNGIVNGMDDGSFQPQGNATRAQLAAILHRYLTM